MSLAGALRRMMLFALCCVVADVHAPFGQEGAAWAKDKDVQEATAKGDWLGKGLS